MKKLGMDKGIGSAAGAGAVILTLGVFLAMLFPSCESPLLQEIRQASEPVVYTVIFDSQEATIPAEPNSISIRHPIQTVGALPSEPLKDGYFFSGWYLEPNGGGDRFNASTLVSTNITVYAWWTTTVSYPVTFNSNGGTPVDTIYVPSGQLVPRPSDPELTGHTLVGWFIDEDLQVEWDFNNYTITSILSLYAKWSVNQYEIVFHANDGSGTTAVQSVNYDQHINLNPNTFQWWLYTFTGWAHLSDGIVEYEDEDPYHHDIDEDQHFFAQWVLQPGTKESFSADDVSFKMAYVPGDYTFPVGVHDDDTSIVEDPFWIAETEVTWELWETVRIWAETNKGYNFQNPGMMGNIPDGEGMTDQHPVSNISWRDSIVWCNALTEWYNFFQGTDFVSVYEYNNSIILDSRDSNAEACDNAVQADASGFRLPTSDEWEMAARWRDNSTNTVEGYSSPWFTKGDSASHAVDSVLSFGASGDVAWYYDNSGGSMKKVGTAGTDGQVSLTGNANSLGLYDMSGNAAEWCFNLSGSNRVNRGGDSMETSPPIMIMIGFESHSAPNHNFWGLRIARSFD